MADRPFYFPLHVKDFSSDPVVEAMSTAGVGAYILLLCKAWHQDPPASLPNDDRVLARFSRMTPDEWQEVKSEVLAAFTLGNDGRMHQKRLRKEYEKFAAKSKKNRAAAHAKWEKERQRQEQEHAHALRTHSERNATRAYDSDSVSDSDSSPSDSESPEQNKTRGSPTRTHASGGWLETRFREFWDVVHHKTGPGRAKTAFAKACKRLIAQKRFHDMDAAADYIIAAMVEFAQTPRAKPKDHRPIHPTTWLNGDNFDDDRETWKCHNGEQAESAWAEHIEKLKQEQQQ